MPTAKELFDQGKLKAAIEALNGEIRAKPADTRLRAFLGELLCFAGEIDRADRTFDIIMQQNLEAAVPVAGVRHLLRGELARREVWREGRVPEFIDQPPEWMRQALQSTVLKRGGDVAGAAKCLAEAEAARPAGARGIGGAWASTSSLCWTMSWPIGWRRIDPCTSFGGAPSQRECGPFCRMAWRRRGPASPRSPSCNARCHTG